MNQDNISIVTKSELCFGCGACNVICPSKAINISFSPNGRLLSQVNEFNCTHCGLCVKVCPGIDTTGKLAELIEPTLIGKVQQTLFARSADKEVFENAQSGGCLTETIAYLFDEGKIDAALVVMQENLKAKYKVITSKDELFKSQTSQYTPIDLVSGLTLLKEFNNVAVVGLPCHIEGIVKLKEINPKKYTNIEYLLGLICAGTQSQLTVEVVKKIAENGIGQIADNDEIRWRQKKFSNYQRADIAIVSPEGNVRMLDNNVRHEAKNYFTPPRCKLCFDKLNLYADIVYGDSWGISGDDAKIGGNVLMCRTSKGKELIDKMFEKGRIVGRSCSIKEIAKGQGMNNKKKMVDSILSFYRQKSYMTPGWAKEEIFKADAEVSNSTQKVVEDYLKRKKKASSQIVNEVTGKIKRKLFFLKIKQIIKSIIKL